MKHIACSFTNAQILDRTNYTVPLLVTEQHAQCAHLYENNVHGIHICNGKRCMVCTFVMERVCASPGANTFR